METIEYDEEKEVCIIMSKADVENSYNEIKEITENFETEALLKWKQFFYYIVEWSK